MEQHEHLLLEPLFDENHVSRRSLLPIWIKVFIWIFMITGAMALICLGIGFSGGSVQLALYGLQSNSPLSPIGLAIILLFLFKGLVAFGLWTEKDWAVSLGIADAILGIAICVYVMAIAPFVNIQPGFVLNLRLELIALIPYLIKLQKINPDWQGIIAIRKT